MNNRRSFLKSLLAAPLVVKAASEVVAAPARSLAESTLPAASRIVYRPPALPTITWPKEVKEPVTVTTRLYRIGENGEEIDVEPVKVEIKMVSRYEYEGD